MSRPIGSSEAGCSELEGGACRRGKSAEEQRLDPTPAWTGEEARSTIRERGAASASASALTGRGEARSSARNRAAQVVERHVADTCVELSSGDVQGQDLPGRVALPSHQPCRGPGEAWARGATAFAAASLGTAIGARAGDPTAGRAVLRLFGRAEVSSDET